MAGNGRTMSPSSTLLTPHLATAAPRADQSDISDNAHFDLSPEHSLPKPRWQDGPEPGILRLWCLEIVSLVFSLALLGVNVGVLAALNNKEYKSWKIAQVDLTPNTVISIIATFTKASLLLSVAEVLSQLKWFYFQRRTQRVLDLQVFDDASRGPLGSLRFLWEVNRHSVMASMGALITILALALEPFTQQVIRYPTKATPATNTTALIGATDTFSPTLFNNLNNSKALQANEVQKLTAAVESAFIKRAPDAAFDCPSGYCEWAPFVSLGMCASCEDVSTLVHTSCEEASTKRLPNSTFKWCKYTTDPFRFPDSDSVDERTAFLAWNLWQSTGDGIYHPSVLLNISERDTTSTSSLVDIVYFRDTETKPNSNTIDGITTKVTRCELAWCANYYGSTKFFNGTLYDSPDIKAPLVLQPGDKLQPDTSNLSTDAAKQLNATERSYIMDNDISSDFYKFLTSLLVTTVYAEDADDNILLDTIPNDYWENSADTEDLNARGTSMYFANDRDIVKTFDNIAISVTNQLRSSDTSTNVTGTVIYTAVYIEVVWPWLVYSIVLTILAAVLLGVTIWLSSKDGRMVWKSSSFAPLFHGLPDDRADGRFVRKETMEKVAKLLYGRLDEDEKGAVKLKLV